MPCQLVELDEAALVEEHLDALAGGLASLGVLLLDRLRRSGVDGLVQPSVQVGELARRRVEIDVLRDFGALAWLCTHVIRPPDWARPCGPSVCSCVNVVPVSDVPSQCPPLDDPLDVDRLSDAGVEVVPEAASTNAIVADRARAGAAEGLVVVTEHQRAGRGRLDRVWHTPARSALTFSVLLRPTVGADRWPWLPLLTGRAVAGTLHAAGFPAGVKWPNDVLIGDHKVAGILVELVATPSGPVAVVGVGLNVRLPAADLPVPTATSLLVEAERRGLEVPDRTGLLLALLGTLRAGYDDWDSGGEPAAHRLRTAYADACVTLGQAVRVELPGSGPLEGDAVGIDAQGRLLVDGGGEQPVAVSAGDVVHVRRR